MKNGEEIAAILKRERKQKMKMHKLTISKVTNRVGFVKSIKHVFSDLEFAERIKMADSLPFVKEEMWTEPSHIESVLGSCCEYTYEQVPFPGNDASSIPPWESPIYLEAMEWMKSLPEEEQKRIQVLIQGSMPWG